MGADVPIKRLEKLVEINIGYDGGRGKKEVMAECKSPIQHLTRIHIIIERYGEIERENRILLEKMSNIMQNPRPQLYDPSKSILYLKLYYF